MGRVVKEQKRGKPMRNSHYASTPQGNVGRRNISDFTHPTDE